MSRMIHDCRIRDLATPEETAAELGCSVATVWRAVARGELRRMRVLGRTMFLRADVHELRRLRAGGRVRP